MLTLLTSTSNSQHRSLAGGKCLDWGACVTSDGHDRPGGAVYQDVAANMLGCFLMGLLSTADSLYLQSGGSCIAILPKQNMWQPSPPVLLGLKTGLCGSLTTFSSWCASKASS